MLSTGDGELQAVVQLVRDLLQEIIDDEKKALDGFKQDMWTFVTGLGGGLGV